MGVNLSSPPSRPDGVTITTNSAGELTLNSDGSQLWEHIETLSPSGATSVTTTGTLPVYDYYLVVGKTTVSTGVTQLLMRLNGDSGSNYERGYYNSVFVTASGQTSLLIGNQDHTVLQTLWTVMLAGKSRAVASGYLPLIMRHVSQNGATHDHAMSGAWIGGNATQVTSITILAGTNTFSGTVEIFGRNEAA